MWDDDQKVPYTYKDQEWNGYDNQASVKIKAEYAKSKGLGGVLVGSIDRDDVNNYCGEGKYPLMRAIKEVLLPHTKSDEDGPPRFADLKKLPKPVGKPDYDSIIKKGVLYPFPN